MASEPIREGFDVFVHDGEKAFGAVRQVSPHGRPELVIYVEGAGDFVVPLTAVDHVDAEKVVLNRDRLEHRLRNAIDHAHGGEDLRI
jgi:hypothetical protein